MAPPQSPPIIPPKAKIETATDHISVSISSDIYFPVRDLYTSAMKFSKIFWIKNKQRDKQKDKISFKVQI